MITTETRIKHPHAVDNFTSPHFGLIDTSEKVMPDLRSTRPAKKRACGRMRDQPLRRTARRGRRRAARSFSEISGQVSSRDAQEARRGSLTMAEGTLEQTVATHPTS